MARTPSPRKVARRSRIKDEGHAKTSNLLPLTDKKGYVIASTTIVAGNHNDAFELKENLVQLFKDLKRQQISIKGAYFNADSAFDTKAARKVCFN